MPAFPPHLITTGFPLLEGAAFDGLVTQARAGQLAPVVLYRGKILNGRNRYRAFRALGLEPPFEVLSNNAAPVRIVQALDLPRRHLTTAQRVAIAAEMAPMFDEATRPSHLAGLAFSGELLRDAIEQAAKALGVDPRSVESAWRRLNEDPEAHERAKRGAA